MLVNQLPSKAKAAMQSLEEKSMVESHNFNNVIDVFKKNNTQFFKSILKPVSKNVHKHKDLIPHSGLVVDGKQTTIARGFIVACCELGMGGNNSTFNNKKNMAH